MDGYDINKFPKQPGLLLFPISLSRIRNAQSAEACFAYLQPLIRKISKPWVGLNFIYGDGLYMNSSEPAALLKAKYQAEMIAHKNAFQNILDKNPWFIQSSFSFLTWNQVLLASREFTSYYGELRRLYHTEELLREAIAADFAESGRKDLDENQVNFFLEESLIFYLILKGKIRLSNEFLHGHEEWILHCYPGVPLKTEMWLHSNNPFRLFNASNLYQNAMYNLTENKIVQLTKEKIKQS